MIPSYDMVLEEAKSLCSRGRSILYAVEGAEFRNRFNLVPDALKIKVLQIIEKGDRHALAKWMDKTDEVDLELWPVRALRRKASRLHIKNYSRLTTVELIKEIKEKLHDKE